METGPLGVSTVMRRRCGCLERLSMSLTLARATSAESSAWIAAALSRRAKPSATSIRLGPVGDARHVGGEARIVRQLGLAEEIARELAPLAVALNGNQNGFAVFGCKYAIGGDGG